MLRTVQDTRYVTPLREGGSLPALVAEIVAGDPGAGPIARLPPRERFQWLVAPRSTIIQVSPVHGGVCESPEAALDEIFRRLVPA